MAYVPLKRLSTSTGLHGATSQNITPLVDNAARCLDLKLKQQPYALFCAGVNVSCEFRMHLKLLREYFDSARLANGQLHPRVALKFLVT
jgi:hypothetical protein